jgi:hypothetical protein
MKLEDIIFTVALTLLAVTGFGVLLVRSSNLVVKNAKSEQEVRRSWPIAVTGYTIFVFGYFCFIGIFFSSIIAYCLVEKENRFSVWLNTWSVFVTFALILAAKGLWDELERGRNFGTIVETLRRGGTNGKFNLKKLPPKARKRKKDWLFQDLSLRRGSHLALRIPTLREQNWGHRFLLQNSILLWLIVALSMTLPIAISIPFPSLGWVVLVIPIFMITVVVAYARRLWRRRRRTPIFIIEASTNSPRAGETFDVRVKSPVLSRATRLRVYLLQYNDNGGGKQRVDVLQSVHPLLDIEHDQKPVWKGKLTVPRKVIGSFSIMGYNGKTSRILFCVSGGGVIAVDGIEVTHPIKPMMTK